MSSNTFFAKLESLSRDNPKLMSESFLELLKVYLDPSLGAMSKSLFEQHLLNTFRKLKVIDENPQLWELIQAFKITRAKASNLLYGANLIRTDFSNEALDNALKELLSTTPYIEDGKMVLLQVDNPLLRDHIKAKLSKNKQLSDGSFSAEIVKMKPKAFVDLYCGLLEKNQSDEITERATKISKRKNLNTAAEGLLEVIKSIGEHNITNVICSICRPLQELIKNNREDSESKIDSVFSAIEDFRKKQEND